MQNNLEAGRGGLPAGGPICHGTNGI